MSDEDDRKHGRVFWLIVALALSILAWLAGSRFHEL